MLLQQFGTQEEKPAHNDPANNLELGACSPSST